MSQHIITIPCTALDGLVRIQLGWDKPMSEFYLVVFEEPPAGRPFDDTKIIYSSVNDHKAQGQQDLGYFKAIAVQLGCIIPENLWRAAYLDREHNIVNKIYIYDARGCLQDSSD